MKASSFPFEVGDLLYDAQVYDGMNTSLNDLSFYKKWLSKDKNNSILELCCGTGRLTLPLAKSGLNLTGVDITHSMLEQAKLKAKKEGLKIRFLEADMRTLDLSETFDVVFIPFNSVHHLYTNQDLFQTLKVVKNHLKKDGLFIFDCFNPNMEFIVEGHKTLKEISNYITEDRRQVTIKEIMRYENDTQVNRIQWHYYINGKFNSIQKLDMRLFFPLELDNYLNENGFKILHKFGSFNEDNFGPNSEKQIFVCEHGNQ